jgi:hypothetical protein
MIKVITISYYKELIEDNRRFDKAELVRRIKEWREIAATNKEQIKKRVALINRQIESIELETYNLMNSINRSNMKDIDTSAVVDLNGLWKTSYFVNNKSGKKVMVTYTITQTPGKNTFSWSVNGPGISETTKDGKITGKGIKIKYNRTAGPHQTGGKYVEVKGTVVTYQGNNRAKEIRWDNGVVWYR